MVKVKGIVVLQKKNTLLDFKDLSSSFLDGVHEILLGKKVSFQLVSAVNADPANSLKGKLGKPSYLKDWNTKSTGLAVDEAVFNVTFEWDEEIGAPGALIVRNEHHSEFFLKTVTLEDVPDHGKVLFVCNSWVYPAQYYEKDRVFFTNKTYLPHQTPALLSNYREEELEILRGKGKENAMLKESDRVYDYAVYNDLGEPEKGPEYARPVFGGSTEYPYPRRGRTGRPPLKTDPAIESRLPLLKGLDIYVPRDEQFGNLKMGDFLGDSVKSLSQGFAGLVRAVLDKTPKEFDSFQDVLDLFEGGIKVPQSPFLDQLRESLPSQFLKAITRNDGAPILKYPTPGIIKEDKSAWSTDEEFAREMLAGIHPLAIRCLEEFPPVSKLDPSTYGNHRSSITEDIIEENLDGLTVPEAIERKRLFILDHYDTMMPYLTMINTNTPSKVYATRTILFLKDDGTLKPLVIELSLPHPDGDQFGAVSEVYKPASDGIEDSIWQLAKAYVAVTDAGYHQLISHWLHTHAVIEPFVIASHRQLSVLHPVHKLLHPHFRDTMRINSIARQTALNPNGLFEQAVFLRQYSAAWSSKLYKDWVFTDQALPRDLVKRGMAVKDSESPHGYKLHIKDYPYAVDGLEVWSAIETWVQEYCSSYYESDDMVATDPELQSWWKEIREIGHGDKKDEDWWPSMTTLKDLTETCTTIIWLASAVHAAVNFGQYTYAGYVPNRPTISRRFMPKPDTPEYEEIKENFELAFLKTIMSQNQALVGVSVIELISSHSSDEVYLGQREIDEWTTDPTPLEAFKKFGQTLVEIEDKIVERNNNESLKNRVGPAKLPYTLLYPSSGVGITGKGIPNSIST
ncbi:probable linoleate 9S-lipoxygenase 5 [Chenopodium quinoa]|uniref:probable linoleate 9S-lipoxygenase 5 n=1 Tax=Chenopodium quinoa TaxID=63459 RepID=UPI000B78E009|nr:probable linoleate 9S-lipoxygenase 5 [Chenopodium quinoa]